MTALDVTTGAAPDPALAQRLAVKLFVDGGELRAREFVPVFHRFIQQHRLDGLWLDVVDYSHVHQGPGAVLIGHHAHLAMDEARGRLGLLYLQKRDLAGPFEERLLSALRAVVTAARHLEHEPALAGRLRFSGHRLLVRLHDRLHAPNRPPTLAALGPAFAALAERLWGEAGAPLEPGAADEREVFSLLLQGRATLDEIAARL